MTLNRLFILVAGCVLSSLVACGGDSGSSAPDAAIVPTGTHYGYVVSEITLPSTTVMPQSIGLDLGSPTSSKLDKDPDNALGTTLAPFSNGLMLPALVKAAVDKGQIVLLADLQTADLANTTAAGFSLKLGVNASATTGAPVPAACTDAADTQCGHHLAGTGMFTIDPASPTDATLAGTIVNGTFNGGPGNLSLQLALGGTSPITLHLVNARVKATSILTTGMTAIVGGLLLPDELNTTIIPVVYDQLVPIINSDCGPEAERTSKENCGCAKDSVGATLMSTLDMASPKDCKVTLEEAQTLLGAELMPDICTKSSCTAPDGLSVGLKVTAVKASFPGLQ
jgi:hypothetical protein